MLVVMPAIFQLSARHLAVEHRSYFVGVLSTQAWKLGGRDIFAGEVKVVGGISVVAY